MTAFGIVAFQSRPTHRLHTGPSRAVACARHGFEYDDPDRVGDATTRDVYFRVDLKKPIAYY